VKQVESEIRDQGTTNDDEVQVLPLVALRDTVIFPEMIVPLQVGRDRSVKALDRAVRANSQVALITQRSSETEEINSVEELYPVGTLAKIAQVIRLQDGTIRAIVQGQRRIRLLDVVEREPHLEARVQVIADEQDKTLEVEALMASVQGQIEQYVSSGASVPPEVAVAARNISDGGLLADMVAYSPDMTTEQRQTLDETVNVESACHATGERIRLRVRSERLERCEPAEAVVSFVSLQNSPNRCGVRAGFCNHVHFFRSAEDGLQWRKHHPKGRLLTVRDAYALAKRIGTARFRFPAVGRAARLPARRPALLATALLLAVCAGGAPAGDDIATYDAEYRVEYRGRFVGRSELGVTYDAEREMYVFNSSTRARGILRLIAPGPVTEKSHFVYRDGEIVPLDFWLDDGTRRGQENIHIAFDWDKGVALAMRADGETELAIEPGVLDRASMQVAIMYDMARSNGPERYTLVDGDSLRTYEYSAAGEETISTRAGEFRAEGFVQRREGSSRTLTIWAAPELRYLPVRIEQHRDGELQTALILESFSLRD
jgi:Lon protease-like protein